jgi:hypothetical protein
MATGPRIGSYALEGELGRGGMGVVHRARAPDGRVVALKLLSHAATPGVRERFERERRLLASFGPTDGFVPVLDAGEERGQPYIVMPLLEGGTLRTRLAHGALSVAATIEVAEALARALSKAHALGIVHRDLKPENLLFGREGPPLLADLGLAKHFDGASPGASRSVSLSTTGQLLGTVGYMAPEQAHDFKTAGPEADVFSAGAVLYECLAGSPAFEGESMLEVLAKVERASPPPVGSVRPETPSWLAILVDRALARDPADRFADGGELLDAIRARGSGGSARRRPRPRMSRRSLLLAPIAVALVALLASVVQGPGTPERERGAEGTGGGSAPPPRVPSLEERIALARARLEGTAPVASSDAPVDLLAPPGPLPRFLTVLAARRAIVYSHGDAERLRGAHASEPAAEVLLALATLHGSPGVRRDAEAKLADAAGFDLAREAARLARAGDALALAASPRGGAPPAGASLRPEALSRAAPEAADLALAPVTDLLSAGALAPEESAERETALKLWRSLPRTDGALLPPRARRAWEAGRGVAEAAAAPAEAALAFEALARDSVDPFLVVRGYLEAVLAREELWQSEGALDEARLEEDERAASAALGSFPAGSSRSAATASVLARLRARALWIRAIRGGQGREAALSAGFETMKAIFVSPADGAVPMAYDYLRYALETAAPADERFLSAITLLQNTDLRRDPRWGPKIAVVLGEEWRRDAAGHPDVAGMEESFRLHIDVDAPGAIYVHSVRALVLADAGRPGDARHELESVPDPRKRPPPLSCLSREAVSKYLADREKR